MTAVSEDLLLAENAFERAALKEDDFSLPVPQQNFERRLDSKIGVSVRERSKRFGESGRKRFVLQRPPDHPANLMWPDGLTLPWGFSKNDL